MRGKTDELNPSDWFYFAIDRLGNADLAWNHLGLTPAGIESLQEAVERLLKGYLIGMGWQLVRTHDLHLLLVDAIVYDSRFSKFERLTEDLTEDFFAQHYPGEDLSNLGNEYDLNRKEIGELLELVRTLLPRFANDLVYPKK